MSVIRSCFSWLSQTYPFVQWQKHQAIKNLALTKRDIEKMQVERDELKAMIANTREMANITGLKIEQKRSLLLNVHALAEEQRVIEQNLQNAAHIKYGLESY